MACGQCNDKILSFLSADGDRWPWVLFLPPGTPFAPRHPSTTHIRQPGSADRLPPAASKGPEVYSDCKH